uniref:C2H2-type domain-containing protein n=1 Tax=Ascaris lumbricoides TaxID=6252 RepID=A0A0M3ICB1_ASCLU
MVEMQQSINKRNPISTPSAAVSPTKEDQTPAVGDNQTPIIKKEQKSVAEENQQPNDENNQMASINEGAFHGKGKSLSSKKKKRQWRRKWRSVGQSAIETMSSKKPAKKNLKPTPSSNEEANGHAASNGNFKLYRKRKEKSKDGKKFMLPLPRARICTLSGTIPPVGYSPKWGGPTMCLMCSEFFDLPRMNAQLTKHLRTMHQILLVGLEHVADPRRYIGYWRNRLAEPGVQETLPVVVRSTGICGEYYYYEISEEIPEDSDLRKTLAMRRLEEALSCQQRERSEENLSVPCLFCRYTAHGNRSKIIHHLHMVHHLNLGSPNNIVFSLEYIEHLRKKLCRNKCICCEKTFKSRELLMSHMRIRKHRQVNVNNHFYDKFYVVNYLEPGKRWVEKTSKDLRDTIAELTDTEEEEENENLWHECVQYSLGVELMPLMCLFCRASSDHLAVLLEHIKKMHNFDIIEIIEKENLNIYERMKMLNFIRKQTSKAICFVCGKNDLGSLQELQKHLTENGHINKGLPSKDVWDTEENLVPAFENDHLLWKLQSMVDRNDQGLFLSNVGCFGCHVLHRNDLIFANSTCRH